MEVWIESAARDAVLRGVPYSPEGELRAAAWLYLGIRRHQPTEQELRLYADALRVKLAQGPYAPVEG